MKNPLDLIRYFVRLKKTPDYYWQNAFKKVDIANDNALFKKISDVVISDGKTSSQHDRLFTLFQCLNQLPIKPVVVEIGVWLGGTSKFIAETLAQIRPDGLLYSCDTFSGHAAVDKRFDGTHSTETFSDNSFENVKDYLKHYKNIIFVVGDIAKTSSNIKADEIHMIHLDVDVFPPTEFVLANLWARLATNGVIDVDDYGFVTCKGARKAVDEFLENRSDCFSFHLLTGQMLLLKK